MNPSFPSNLNDRNEPNGAVRASQPETVWDALGNAWSGADLAMAAERAAAYLARQVLPAFDPSDPRAGGDHRSHR